MRRVHAPIAESLEAATHWRASRHVAMRDGHARPQGGEGGEGGEYRNHRGCPQASVHTLGIAGGPR